jgi:hypothetical protein
MWLFARFGGEWATQYDMPVPGSGQLVNTKYTSSSYGDYVEKLSLYISQATPEELREWFVQAGVPMTPILLSVERNTYIDQPDYYFETPLYFHLTPLNELHILSAMITAGWWEDFIPHCQRVRISEMVLRLPLIFQAIPFQKGIQPSWYPPAGRMCVKGAARSSKLLARRKACKRTEGAGKRVQVRDGVTWLKCKHPQSRIN